MAQNGTFSAKQLAFIEWLAEPKYTRSPPTQELFGKSIGVSKRTLCRWKKDEGFLEAVIARARELLKSSLPDVYASLRIQAIEGSFQHTKLILELTGEYTEKNIIAHESAVPIQIVEPVRPDDGTD